MDSMRSNFLELRMSATSLYCFGNSDAAVLTLEYGLRQSIVLDPSNALVQALVSDIQHAQLRKTLRHAHYGVAEDL